MLTTNIEALRGLYVALGGNVADVADITTLPEMLEKISTVASAAASELPPVKSADNGDVLTVVNGKWAKATPASGSKTLVVTFSGSNGETCDKTLSEVLTAINNGYTIIADISGVTGIQNLPEHFKMHCVSHNNNCIGFLGLSIIGDDYKAFYATLENVQSTVWAAQVA